MINKIEIKLTAARRIKYQGMIVEQTILLYADRNFDVYAIEESFELPRESYTLVATNLGTFTIKKGLKEAKDFFMDICEACKSLPID